MKTLAPRLAPILRSEVQGRLLNAVFTDPDREQTVGALASAAGTSHATAWREVERAAAAGVVETRKAGQALLVRANTKNRFYPALHEIIVGAFGPPAAVTDEIAEIDGVHALVLFGSWVRRYQGEAGGPPADLDVLVVGDPNRSAVYEAAERVQQQVGLPVHVTFRSDVAWAKVEDPFLNDVRARPLMVLAVDDTLDGLDDLRLRMELPT